MVKFPMDGLNVRLAGHNGRIKELLDESYPIDFYGEWALISLVEFTDKVLKGVSMKSAVTIFLMAFSLTVLAEETCEHDRTTFRCVKFVKNYDADTVTFNIPNTHPLIGEKISVRVLGLDTPEIKGKTTCEKKKAIEAKDFVSKLMKEAKKIDLENVQKDKYFRILADVKVDGKSLTKELLDKGYAYPYHGKTKLKVDWCKGLRLPAAETKK